MGMLVAQNPGQFTFNCPSSRNASHGPSVRGTKPQVLGTVTISKTLPLASLAACGRERLKIGAFQQARRSSPRMGRLRRRLPQQAPTLQRSPACLVMRSGRWPSGDYCTNSRAPNLHLNKCYSANIACVSLQGQVVLTWVIAMTAIGDNHVQIFKFSALILLASAVLAGCSSTPVAQTSAKSTETPAVVPMLTPATSSAPKPVVSSVTLPPHLDPKSPISTERSIYFDFDVFTIKPDYLKLVEQHGNYLLSKPALSIRIEGNADERGNSEYNLALGQKRAQAVLQALKTYGVTESQMEAVSWGKERPKATGHDESAWKENRRADLVYPKQ